MSCPRLGKASIKKICIEILIPLTSDHSIPIIPYLHTTSYPPCPRTVDNPILLILLIQKIQRSALNSQNSKKKSLSDAPKIVVLNASFYCWSPFSCKKTLWIRRILAILHPLWPFPDILAQMAIMAWPDMAKNKYALVAAAVLALCLCGWFQTYIAPLL